MLEKDRNPLWPLSFPVSTHRSQYIVHTLARSSIKCGFSFVVFCLFELYSRPILWHMYYYHLHFTKKETQSRKVTCPKSQQLDSRAWTWTQAVLGHSDSGILNSFQLGTKEEIKVGFHWEFLNVRLFEKCRLYQLSQHLIFSSFSL